MIANRIWLLPIWIQALARIAQLSIGVGAIEWLLYPRFVHRAGWPLAALSVIALCAIATAATMYLQLPVRRQAHAVLGGDRAHQLAALDAFRSGSVPADPDVLAAAVRYGSYWEAYRRKFTRRQRITQWAVPVVFITYGALNLLWLPVQFGAMLIVVGLLWLVTLTRGTRLRRRIQHNLVVLRDAAPTELTDAVPEAAEQVPPLRRRLVVAAILIPTTAFMLLVYLVGRPTPACNTVSAVMRIVYDNRQLTDSQNMTRGQPDLAAYENWSRQLHAYANHETDPTIAPRVQRIAELSSRAVAEFKESRDALVGVRPDFDLAEAEKRFSATMQALVDEDNALGKICP